MEVLLCHHINNKKLSKTSLFSKSDGKFGKQVCPQRAGITVSQLPTVPLQFQLIIITLQRTEQAGRVYEGLLCTEIYRNRKRQRIYRGSQCEICCRGVARIDDSETKKLGTASFDYKLLRGNCKYLHIRAHHPDLQVLDSLSCFKQDLLPGGASRTPVSALPPLQQFPPGQRAAGTSGISFYAISIQESHRASKKQRHTVSRKKRMERKKWKEGTID